MHACEFHLVAWIYVDVDQYGVHDDSSGEFYVCVCVHIQVRREIKSPLMTSHVWIL